MNLFGKEMTKDSYPLYVCEISCNHNGSLQQAKELIHAAKEAGADACKIQCYDADEMTLNIDSGFSVSDFDIKYGLWKGRHLYDLYSKTETNYEMVQQLFAYADSINMHIFSSVFSEKGLIFLRDIISCTAYKIASFENNDIELITKVAKTGKPLLISTGMASVADINRIVSIVNPLNTVLMHCVSSYPADTYQANLWKINFLRGFYPIVVGYSDHTKNHISSQLAVALGAKVIEKHITIEKNTEDSEFSVSPDEFAGLIANCNDAWNVVKNSNNDPEADSRQFRRSLYVVEDMEPGEQFTSKNVRSIRPSYGLEPYRYQEVITRTCTMSIKAGTALEEGMLA